MDVTLESTVSLQFNFKLPSERQSAKVSVQVTPDPSLIKQSDRGENEHLVNLLVR
jgi:hypothetical protein